MVAGNIAPDSGKVIFDGEDVTGLKPHQLFRTGMLRTFQIAHEFSNMTALENLMVVASDQPGETLLNAWIRPGLVASRDREVRQKAQDVVESLKPGPGQGGPHPAPRRATVPGAPGSTCRGPGPSGMGAPGRGAI